jgi:hypothetical protein
MSAKADRNARASTETLARWQLAEVPSRAVQVNVAQENVLRNKVV